MKYWAVFCWTIAWLIVPTCAWGTSPDLPRLVYVFSPELLEQREYLQELDRLARLYKGRLTVIGIVRSNEDEKTLTFHPELTFSLVPAIHMAQQGEDANKLGVALTARKGYLLLKDKNGITIGDGTDYELNKLKADLIHLINPGISTDIDQSTWGKVKELFK